MIREHRRMTGGAIGLVVLMTVLVWADNERTSAASGIQPQKVALVILENASYDRYLSCDAGAVDPFICAHLAVDTAPFHATVVSGGGADHAGYYAGVTGSGGYGTGQHCGDGTSGCFASSAQQYGFMTSGDNCHGGVKDGTFNRGEAALAAGAPDYCGTDIYRQLDDAGLSWTDYYEGFVANAQMHANGDCRSGFSDSPNEHTAMGHQQYARRHAPATFYADVAADCITNGTRHVRDFPLPVGDTGNSSTSLDENRGAFAGMADGWPAFSVIVPDLCHDGHNAIHACDNNGFHALADAGGSPACHSLAGNPPGTGSEEVAKHGTVDCWLQENLRDIAMDVGSNGVVIITTDEGTSGGARLPMIIVPGQNGNGIASALSCKDGAPCATSTFYDHGSTIRALEDAFAAQDTTGSIGCSQLSGPVDGSPDLGFGYDNCIHATPLPIKFA
jgi:hypothetical protein